ncbi:hypothetical protein FPV67DRAFT_1522717 [Lyophyllum atratum]|nr:hypothetical protein FPV67DRAFT_1522717 [Lyophyllum atratum]
MTTTSSGDSLKSWAQAGLTALYGSSSNASDTDFRSSFDTLFSSQAEILVNHVALALDGFKDDIKNRAFAATRVSIAWKEIVEVPKADSPENEAGIVAGCFVVTRSLKFRIRAAPAQSNTTVVFSAKIDRDPSIQDGDPRRIMHMFQTISDKAAPIHLQGMGQSAQA